MRLHDKATARIMTGGFNKQVFSTFTGRATPTEDTKSKKITAQRAKQKLALIMMVALAVVTIFKFPLALP